MRNRQKEGSHGTGPYRATSSAAVAAIFVPVSELGDSRTNDPAAEPSVATTSGIDFDAIQRDLEGVQTALERLNEGTYWTDEVTGGIIPDEILEAFPLTRTVAGNTGS